MGVNYFGHVLLAELLLKSIEVKKIIAITCPSHLLSRINPINLGLNSHKGSYDQLRQYALSNLSKLLYIKLLAERTGEVHSCAVAVSSGNFEEKTSFKTSYFIP